LMKGVAVPSLGYQGPGVTPALNVITGPLHKTMNHCLKTASGFGGCNAAIVFSKN
jgi:3-oxoacyl-[acyl-carrier-protein] synthase I